MKYRILIFGLMVLAAALTAVSGDVPYGYRSLGTDTYASGEPVRDGECYAFVWVRNGFEFVGYNRDGSLVDRVNNAEVYVRSLAQGGKCPPVNFVVPEEFALAHADGSYHVLVLDTRCSSGTPSGLSEEGALWRVNGWGYANVKSEAAAAKRLNALASVAATLGSQVSEAAKIPSDCRRPVITAFSFDAAGNAVVEFEGTERYLSYRLTAGETPTDAGAVDGQECRDGSGTAEKVRLTLKREELKGSSAAFMRVEAVTNL